MKKFCAVFLFLAVGSLMFSAGEKEAVDVEQWPSGPVTVICPWAVGGVADMVNRRMAGYGEEVFGQPIVPTNEFLQDGVISLSSSLIEALSPMLGAGGNVALTNFLKNEANALELILGGESAFAVAPNITGAGTLQFTYDDFVPIINLYSSIFVMTANASLNITDLESLKAYGAENELTMAVNGMASIEAFMAKILFRELGVELSLVAYNGANLALAAAVNGETHLAISHQSQARQSIEDGALFPVVAFDKEGLKNGVFAGVKGVGEYGYTAYCRNRAFLMARKGTDPAVIQKIHDAYSQILAKDEIVELFHSMMIEIDPLDGAAIDQHIAAVAKMVKSNQ